MPTYYRKPLGNEKLVRTGSLGYVPESVLTGLDIPYYEIAQNRRDHNRKNKRKAVMNGSAFKPGGHLYHLTEAAQEAKKQESSKKKLKDE